MNLKLLLTSILFLLNSTCFSQTIVMDYTVGQTFLIQSEILNDKREVQVFLPDGYAESEKDYPVLYILDGQRYFLHGVSLQKSFVEFRQAPEFIVVGIPKNQSDGNTNFSTNSENILSSLKKKS